MRRSTLRLCVPRPGGASLAIETNHSAGLRQGDTIYVGGQAALGPGGEVLFPGELDRQVEASIDAVEEVLAELGADIRDVVKLVCFYVSDGRVDEAALLARLRARFSGEPAPACMILPLPALAYPGMEVEIECIAMRGEEGECLPRRAGNPAGHWPWPFSHGLRCGEMFFIGAQGPYAADGSLRAPGAVVEQAKINIENIAKVAAELGASLDDICRFNTFYVGHGTVEDWARAAEVRGNAFERPGVCGTGVPVPTLFPEGLTIRQEATGMLGLDGSRLERRPSLPEGHWDWPIPVKAQQGVRIGRRIMIGGQVAADRHGKAVHPNDLPAQTRVVMDFIKAVVEDLGGTMDDVVKVNAFYKDTAGADPEVLHSNLAVRSGYFTKPGPVSTGIPLKALGLEDKTIEVEAYAMLGE